ncbi:GMC oxidoreductase [Popillia japonica]|uniref:GMC oxidoreductase n=1 Tax=Popillia japonica TaxID=7064 RepID=A0AAW1N3I0_POPJA
MHEFPPNFPNRRPQVLIAYGVRRKVQQFRPSVFLPPISPYIINIFRFLLLAVPPQKPTIIDEKGKEVPSVAGPYDEGGDMKLTCIVTGESSYIDKSMMKTLVVLSLCVWGVTCQIPDLNTLLANLTWNFNVEKDPYEDFVWHNRVARELDQKYDFIIVGSGPAGAVIANRLSENPNWNILLLEIGDTPTALTDIPILVNYYQFTDYNWGYLIEEQPNMCLGLVDRRMAWPRGRVLGGTSVINFMIHIRGNRGDYNRWAADGNPGWSYEDVLPYFKKSEDFLVKIQDPEYHRQGGYLGVQDVDSKTKAVAAFVEAMQEFGYKYVDYNGKEQIGVSYMHATLRNGKRASAYNAFLAPIRYRRNLKIYTGARVTKILIDETTKAAYGVLFEKNRKNYLARAAKEVIISAGALSSPQLLMLSGIGPKEHLEELNIPVIQNLPVGQKLYDHLTFLGLMFTVNEINESITARYQDLFTIPTMLEYLKYRRGLLATLSGAEAGLLATLSGAEALGIVKTSASDDPDPTYPDMEFIFIGGGLHTDNGDIYRKTFRISDESYNRFWKPLEGKQAFNVLPMLYHPKSYGFLKLKSNSPYHRPKFYGNYFTDPDNHDIKTFIASIRLMQEIAKMPAFQRYNTTIWDVKVLGCDDHEFNSDEYWECALRHLSVTLHHQVSTCRMGPSTDPDAVIDHQLKVHGIKNLRVADTSIIPRPISAHTNVPSFMIGEKAADLIKETWERMRQYHSRGNRKDYDRWEESGNAGWSFQDVLPHFKKSEDFLVKIQDPEYHQQGGLAGWSFQDVLPHFKKSEDFLVKIQDPEYHQQGGLLGVQDVPYRSGSSKAFMDSMLESGYDYVDYNGRQQMGVSFVHEKEVILSAGSFSSPQLLMLSEVGPREHLEEMGISVIQDLSDVGQNLADHAILHGITFTQQYGKWNRILAVHANKRRRLRRNMESNSSHASRQHTTDVIPRKIPWISTIKIQEPLRCSIILWELLHCPYDVPLFYGNYFTDPNNDDIKVMTSAIRVIQQLIKMPAWQRYNAQLV